MKEAIEKAEALLEEARRLPLGWRERNNLLLEAHLVIRLAEHKPKEPAKAPAKKAATPRRSKSENPGSAGD